MYKFVKIASFYKNFITHFYQSHPKIQEKPYPEHFKILMEQGFAWADFFSQHLQKLGIESHEIIYNDEKLQQNWAKHHNIPYNTNIVFEQLKYYKPDVIFFQDTNLLRKQLIDEIKKQVPSVRLAIGHICAPFQQHQIENYKQLDFILTCTPHFANILTKAGIKNYFFAHGFEASLLNKINDFDKTYDCLFIGSFIPSQQFHDDRIELIQFLLEKNVPLQIISDIQKVSSIKKTGILAGYYTTNFLKQLGLQSFVEHNSTLKKLSISSPEKFASLPKSLEKNIKHQALYGIKMLQTLAKAKYGLNIHGGIAGEYAANVRMYEVTGVGSLLITDHKKNIKDFFEPDYEIITYKSKEECLEKMQWLQQHPKETAAIAKAGQQRTLQQHTIELRVNFLNELIKKHLLK